MSNNQLEVIHHLIIAEFAKTVEMFDLSPSEARLFSILYLEGAPMTLDQMSEALGKSKTSISNGIRSLLDLNLVERVWKKGVRKDLYKADKNLYRKFMKSYTHKWVEAASRQKSSLEEIEEMLKKDTKENSTECIELEQRIKELIGFHQLVEESFKEINPNKMLQNYEN